MKKINIIKLMVLLLGCSTIAGLQAMRAGDSSSSSSLVDQLCVAASEGKIDDFHRLIRNGAKVNYRGKYRKTPLHWAVEYGHAACVQLLLDVGADVHSRNQFGSTTLHIAVLFRNIVCVQLLLDAGADVHSRNQFGDTPLHSAVLFRNIACVQLLLDAGADVHSRNQFGVTPLLSAARCATGYGVHTDQFRKLIVCIKLLLAAGAVPDLGKDPASEADRPLIANTHTRAQEIVNECYEELLVVRRAAIVDRMRSVPELNDFPPGLLPLIASFSSLEN